MCGDYNGNEEDDFNNGGRFKNQAEFLDHWVDRRRPGVTNTPGFADPLSYWSQSRPYASQLCATVMGDVSSVRQIGNFNIHLQGFKLSLEGRCPSQYVLKFVRLYFKSDIS